MHKSKWVPLSIHETKQGPVGPSQGQSLFVPLAETSTRETKHPTWIQRPGELTLQALIPEQGFYTWTGMIKQVCEFAGAGQLQRAGQGWVR